MNSSNQITVTNDECLFWNALENKNLKMAKEIYSVSIKIDIKDTTYLGIAVANNDVDSTQWLYSLYNDANVGDINNYIFATACSKNCGNIAQWIYKLDNKVYKLEFGIDILSDACFNGHLETIKLIYSIDEEKNNYTVNNFLFEKACCYDQLEIAQWLYSFTGKIFAENSNYISIACQNGAINVAQWLYMLNNNVDLCGEDNFTFLITCKNGHTKVAQWLYSIINPGVDAFHKIPETFGGISNRQNALFENACRKGHLEMAQWIYSIDSKITADDVKLIIFTSKYDRPICYPRYAQEPSARDIAVKNWLAGLL